MLAHGRYPLRSQDASLRHRRLKSRVARKAGLIAQADRSADGPERPLPPCRARRRLVAQRERSADALQHDRTSKRPGRHAATPRSRARLRPCPLRPRVTGDEAHEHRPHHCPHRRRGPAYARVDENASAAVSGQGLARRTHREGHRQPRPPTLPPRPFTRHPWRQRRRERRGCRGGLRGPTASATRSSAARRARRDRCRSLRRSPSHAPTLGGRLPGHELCSRAVTG